MSSENKRGMYLVLAIIIVGVAALVSFFDTKETTIDGDLITAAMAHGPTENCLFGTEQKYKERPCYMTIAMGPQFIMLGPGAENAYSRCVSDPYILSEFLAKTQVCEKERVHVCYQSRAREILYLNGECV